MEEVDENVEVEVLTIVVEEEVLEVLEVMTVVEMIMVV